MKMNALLITTTYLKNFSLKENFNRNIFYHFSANRYARIIQAMNVYRHNYAARVKTCDQYFVFNLEQNLIINLNNNAVASF